MSRRRKWPKRITVAWPYCERPHVSEPEDVELWKPSERREYVLVTRKRVRK